MSTLSSTNAIQNYLRKSNFRENIVLEQMCSIFDNFSISLQIPNITFGGPNMFKKHLQRISFSSQDQDLLRTLFFAEKIIIEEFDMRMENHNYIKAYCY
jgi:hypothetical protein